MYYVTRGERLTAICRQAARCWRAPSNCGINPLLVSSKYGGVSVSPETAGLQRSFALDSGILAPGSAVNVDLGASTDADIALAILMDAPFPARENGEIALGSIGLSVAGNSPLAFSGNGTTVGFELAAGMAAGAGIFATADRALAALGFSETPVVALDADAPRDPRYAVLRAGYKASGEVRGTHPIGAVGSLAFGVSGAASGVSGVVHRFAAATGARSVLDRTVHSWKLPRHVDRAERLAPGTWLFAEANGTIAARLGARLGYNFNFVHEAGLAGLSGDIGLKIDAAATATFGFEVSGRYVIVISRDSEQPRLRVQMFKLSRQGLNAGQNIKVGVTGLDTLSPDKVDEFVAAVFGVHGAQIASALQRLDQWTDPETDVRNLVTGLTRERALDLLKRVTGKRGHSREPFEAQRAKLIAALGQLDKLPAGVRSELLGLLPKLASNDAGKLRRALARLASDDTSIQEQALRGLLDRPEFSSTPIGRLLVALGERGLLALLDRLSDVRSIAANLLSILDGGVVKRLQKLVTERLSLDDILGARTERDFTGLDSFLLGRLSAFFEKTIQFADLEEIQQSIHLVLAKRADVYDKVRKALHSRYALDLTETWQRADARTAVLDVVFDTSKDEGRALLASVLQDAEVDLLMTAPSQAVEIRSAVLTHELTRKTVVDVSLPYFASHTESFNTSLARVSAEEDGGRVLMYDATGEDVVVVRNRFRSSLSVSIAAVVPAAQSAMPDLRVHSTGGSTWSYTLRHGRDAMRRAELEAVTRPFIAQYMADQFSDGASLGTWYADLDRTVESILANGPDEFGDVLATMEVTMPGETLGAWMLPVADVPEASKRVSKAIQAALKRVLPFYYLSDVSRLHTLSPSAALLGWASIRPSNDVTIENDRFVFDAGRQVFWDHVDADLRRQMVLNSITRQNLLARLAPLRLRLEEAGMHRDVEFYEDGQASRLLSTAAGAGDQLLRGLLTFESTIATRAAEAVADIQGFLTASSTSPSKAIARLAEFAADITTSFNKLAGDSVFAGVSFRAVSQVVFAEASRALDPGLLERPRAMLALAVLRPDPARTFRISDFLAGGIPPDGDVVLAQHLVSI